MQEDFSKYNSEGTTLRRAQLRMLEILVEIDKICCKHNIQYWLDSGTLLGAIRHDGFIPWDDDLDIAVLRKDYKKLRKALQEELPEQFVIQDWTTEKKYPIKFGKVRDRKSYYYTNNWDDKVKENGIFIDIFSVEKGNSKLKKIADFLYKRAFRRIRRDTEKKYEIFIAYLIWPLACVLVCIARLLALLTSDQMVYAYGTTAMQNEFSKNDIFPLQQIQFEGLQFYSPKNPNGYLTSLYGNYMTIPIEKDRETHTNHIEIYD